MYVILHNVTIIYIMLLKDAFSLYKFDSWKYDICVVINIDMKVNFLIQTNFILNVQLSYSVEM